MYKVNEIIIYPNDISGQPNKGRIVRVLPNYISILWSTNIGTQIYTRAELDNYIKQNIFIYKPSVRKRNLPSWW